MGTNAKQVSLKKVRNGEIGKKIRSERIKAGLSTTELAKRCDMDKTTIANYERGHRMPSLARLVIIAEQIGCPLSRLVGEDDVENNKEEKCLISKEAALKTLDNLSKNDIIPIELSFKLNDISYCIETGAWGEKRERG